MRSRRLGCRGQIVIPALIMFPTLMLFVFLIFETAKLSRDKIRHQFAIDSAAFVEMTNYTDFLNRSAYVNGAFPMRIFREGFHDTMLDCLGRDPCPGKRPLDDILYDDGVFPRDADNPGRDAFTTEPKWSIAYSNISKTDDRPATGQGKNEDPPRVDDVMTLISMHTAKYWNINWDDSNQIYNLYVQIFQLLGSVESAQFSVLKRLTGGHTFLKKSYWLNTGGDTALAEAAGAVRTFGRAADGFPAAVRWTCAQKLTYYGNQLTHSWGQPYQIWHPEKPIAMPDTIPECQGLFQAVSIEKSAISSMREKSAGGYPGWPVETRWNASSNYFNVDLNTLMANSDGGPRVHATVSAAGFGAEAAVWPYPTPKFQVRLYP